MVKHPRSAFERLGLKQEDFATQCGQESSRTQRQTAECFGFKWAKRDTYESEAMRNQAQQWLLKRYLGNDTALLDQWLGDGGKLILDAGCGAGFTAPLLFGRHLERNSYLGVDISTAVDTARERFLQAGIPGDFAQCDLMRLPIPDSSLDVIFSEGVLHHTDDTGAAVKYLAGKLRPGGKFLFYVYAKKAVIREFTDDYIRHELQKMDNEEAWRALESLTRLGEAFGKLDVDLEVPEDIPFLGIEKGRTSLQRFFYYNICKLYYRPEFSRDEMNHINFDWFRPLNCHRHTPQEVEAFCAAAGMDVARIDVEKAGITVVATKY